MTSICDLFGQAFTAAGLTAVVMGIVSYILERIPGWHDLAAQVKQGIVAGLCFPVGLGLWFLAPKFGCTVPPLENWLMAVLMVAWGFFAGTLFHLAHRVVVKATSD